MMLSTRADPPRFLEIHRPPISGSNLRHILLNSPLPSPSLPSILPRHGKKPPRLNTKRILRLISWTFVLTLVFEIFQKCTHTVRSLENLTYESSNGREYQIVGAIDVPNFASPVAVTNQRGQASWTISIPSSLTFPLSGSDYDDICLQAEDVSSHVAGLRHNLRKIQSLHYNELDPNYVEIDEAQMNGLLPAEKYFSNIPAGQQVCKKSLTYVLDATEAGLGETLLGLWLSYGLAKREERSFFIDYSNFAYGKYTSLFSKLPPTPDCRPPPWVQRTPCPSYAKHLIVSASTLKWTFGLSFQKEYNTKEVFAMAREGYEALFHMNEEDVDYVNARLTEQRQNLVGDGLLVGIHIRRGDRHPFEYQYQHGYLPPSKYMSAAQNIVESHEGSVILLASDDADIYHHPEVEGTVRAQDKIRLASKNQLNHAELGWEGGFFKDAFWDIGLPEHALKQKYIGSPEPSRKQQQTVETAYSDHHRDYRSQPTKQALQLRGYLARAYMLDLAMLAGSDQVVCGVSSRACRILAVMMGWDKLHQGHWKNVDGDYGWRALFA